MNAWLITWEGTELHKNELDKIAAILNSRKSEKSVMELIELLYLRSTCNASAMAHFVNCRKEIPFKAYKDLSSEGILYPERCYCGSGQFMLYARRVTNLKICLNKEKGKEVLTWVEPSTYHLDQQRYNIEHVEKGKLGEWERDHLSPLSKDTW